MSHSHRHDGGDHGCCSHPSTNPSLTQTLDEMDWDRGIWSAALSGDVTGVQRLLRSRCEVNAVDTSGYTALHYACRNGHTEVVSILLDHGADPNIQTRSGGATPLHRAAYGGHLRIVYQLLHAHADASITDSDGKTALHKAAENTHVGICKVLVNDDPSLGDILDKRGRRASQCVNQDRHDLRELLTYPVPDD